MKYILSFILISLFVFPSCGMVFAGMMNEDGHHSVEQASLEKFVDHDHLKSEHYCCENSDSSVVNRNLVPASNEVRVVSNIAHVFLKPFSLED